MKIDSGAKPVILPNAIENRPAQTGTGQRAGNERTDVTVSTRASQLQALESQLAAIPVVDRARVERIKEAIAAGEYAVKPENVAQGLIDSVKELLNVAKPK